MRRYRRKSRARRRSPRSGGSFLTKKLFIKGITPLGLVGGVALMFFFGDKITPMLAKVIPSKKTE